MRAPQEIAPPHASFVEIDAGATAHNKNTPLIKRIPISGPLSLRQHSAVAA